MDIINEGPLISLIKSENELFIIIFFIGDRVGSIINYSCEQVNSFYKKSFTLNPYILFNPYIE